MLSKLTDIVTSIIGDRKEEIAKKVFNYENKINGVEKKLNKGEINLSQAMDEVHKLFSFHLKDRDYREIEKRVDINI